MVNCWRALFSTVLRPSLTLRQRDQVYQADTSDREKIRAEMQAVRSVRSRDELCEAGLLLRASALCKEKKRRVSARVCTNKLVTGRRPSAWTLLVVTHERISAPPYTPGGAGRSVASYLLACQGISQEGQVRAWRVFRLTRSWPGGSVLRPGQSLARYNVPRL